MTTDFPCRGRRYDRRRISEELGGSIQTYLPTRHGRIVAICLDPVKNPGAPREILVGTGPRIRQAGRDLVRQGGPLPVFLKRGAGLWEAMGDHEVVGSSEAPELLEEKAALRPAGVTLVVWLAPVSEEA